MESTGIAPKIGTWLIATGSFIAFAGLCFLPAAFGSDPDRSALGAGFAVFAVGVLLIAAGLYTKARTLAAANPAGAAATSKRARKSNCDRCGQDEPVIQCRVHQLHLCANCLASHYDFRSCAYVPSTRRGAPLKSSAASAHSQAASS